LLCSTQTLDILELPVARNTTVRELTALIRDLFFLPKEDILRGSNSTMEYFYTLEINDKEIEPDTYISLTTIKPFSITKLKVTIIKNDIILGIESSTFSPKFHANVIREDGERYRIPVKEEYYI
jgi:hypothetical protein